MTSTLTQYPQAPASDAIRPFQFRASDEALADLRRRVAAARLPERETVTDFSQGVPLATTQKLARYSPLTQYLTEMEPL